MNEKTVVSNICRFLDYAGFYHLNIHGSVYSQNGSPDIATHDDMNTALYIEAKRPGKSLEVNQAEHAARIIKAGNRYVVGHYDFDLNRVLAHDVPVLEVEYADDTALMVSAIMEKKIVETTEIILK